MTESIAFLSARWWEIVVGGIATVGIYSFLYRENRLYRFFEHLFIGISTGLGIMSFIRSFILPQVIKPIGGLDRIVFPDGTIYQPYDSRLLLYLIPIAFGLFYYAIYFPRYNWLAQIVIGFSLGLSGGLAFKGIFNEMMPQLVDSFRPLWGSGSLATDLSNLLFLTILFTASCYFFFTFKRRPGGAIERSSAVGRLMLMGCFGAFFGATIMARMALLVERLQFLIEQWVPSLRMLF